LMRMTVSLNWDAARRMEMVNKRLRMDIVLVMKLVELVARLNEMLAMTIMMMGLMHLKLLTIGKMNTVSVRGIKPMGLSI